MLPVRSALLSSAGAGPSTSSGGGGASGSGTTNPSNPPPTRGRSSPQLLQQQRRAERREAALLALGCAALLCCSWFLGVQIGKASSPSASSSHKPKEAWRARRARQEALAAAEAEVAPGLLRREREREAVLDRLKEGKCKGELGPDGAWRYDEEEQGGAEAAETEDEQEGEKEPSSDEATKKAARLAALAERLSQHPAAKGLNLSSAQQAELNHNGYEDPYAKYDDPDDTEFRVLCVGDSLTMGLYQNSGKYRPYAIALERVLKQHLSSDPSHDATHRRGSEDRHEHGAPKKRLERKRHRAKSVHVVSSGIGGETVLGGMRDRMAGLLQAAEGRRREGGVGGGGNATTASNANDDDPGSSNSIAIHNVDARRYDVVVIFGGVNDILRDKAESERLFKQGLSRMYGRARRGHGAATLAVTLLDVSGVANAELTKQPDGQPDTGWKRADLNNRIRVEAAEAFAHDLQSEEVRRMDGDWSDGGVGPLGVFDAAAEVPLFEKQEEKDKDKEKVRTPYFDADGLHLTYDGYERLGELMAKRIIEMGWI